MVRPQALNSVRHRIASRSPSLVSEPMSGQEIETTIANVALPRGYRLELLRRHEIPALAAAVKAWFPEISVGGASCYLREEFFHGDVHFRGECDKDVLVVLIKKGREPAGLFSCQRDCDALSLYARL